MYCVRNDTYVNGWIRGYCSDARRNSSGNLSEMGHYELEALSSSTEVFGGGPCEKAGPSLTPS